MYTVQGSTQMYNEQGSTQMYNVQGSTHLTISLSPKYMKRNLLVVQSDIIPFRHNLKYNVYIKGRKDLRTNNNNINNKCSGSLFLR